MFVLWCSLLAAWGYSPAYAATALQLDVTRAAARLVSVGERGGIAYSDDQGRSWQAAMAGGQQLLTAVYFVDGQCGWAVGHDAQILATEDGGAHWIKQFEDPAREAPLLDLWFADRQRGFAVGAYGYLLGTHDGGASWQDLSTLLDNPEQLHLNAIAEARDGALFIAGEAGRLFRSLDHGATWERLPVELPGSLFGLLATGAPQTLLAFGVRGHLYRSADNGAHWQPIPLPGAPLSLAGGTLLADGTLVLVGGDRVLRSSDGGRSFVALDVPTGQALAAVSGTADGALVVAGQGGLRRVAMPRVAQ
jgi:photosystem II stability/assembly factor-like uncharacterized protein